jgi:imidazolonepropionase-like amidohydrolase
MAEPSEDHGRLILYFLRRPVGEETYQLSENGGQVALNAAFSYTERGSTVALNAQLRMDADLTPVSFAAKGRSYRPFSVDATVERHGANAVVHDGDGPARQIPTPSRFFTISGYNPLSVQMMLLRYWMQHGRPHRLPQLPDGDDLMIREAGRDIVQVRGARSELVRYDIGNLVWGHETVWLDSQQRVAAAASYAGNLPLEAVAPLYESALPDLLRSSDRDRFAETMRWKRTIRPIVSGRYAISNVRLFDGSGRPPLDNASIIVDGGKITTVGDHLSIPAGIRVIDGRQKSLLPGLWEMHAHFAQVDYGPAYLAAGVTTARDLGGEREFLTGVHALLDAGKALGPRLLLACLVDGSGDKSFGVTYADTPEQGRAVVDKCKADGFVQMKIYDYVQPEVLRAITVEAHRLGMSVTGHVPRALSAEQAVLAGMDQINHLGGPLQYAKGDDTGPLVPTSPNLARATAFFREHHTVIDPTQAWGELLGRPLNVPIESFEPGFAKAPATLRAMIGSSGTAPSDEVTWGLSSDAALLIRTLDSSGVPIVAGTDKALPAHSFHRELELYVKAGLEPAEVIRLATSGSAKVMGIDHEVGTIAPGMRADMILVDGNPLEDFSAMRRVLRVITAGQMYDPAILWQVVGFKP